MIRKVEKDYVLLLCGEWLRDELMWGSVPERRRAKIESLKSACFDALGDLSVADAVVIREKFNALADKIEVTSPPTNS